MEFLKDDKAMVIVAATVIAIAVIFVPELNPEKGTIISSIITGMFGIAIGRALK
jgi:uncharacterized membrane protein YjjB (DUF3815 family)